MTLLLRGFCVTASFEKRKRLEAYINASCCLHKIGVKNAPAKHGEYGQGLSSLMFSVIFPPSVSVSLSLSCIFSPFPCWPPPALLGALLVVATKFSFDIGCSDCVVVDICCLFSASYKIFARRYVRVVRPLVFCFDCFVRFFSQYLAFWMLRFCRLVFSIESVL